MNLLEVCAYHETGHIFLAHRFMGDIQHVELSKIYPRGGAITHFRATLTGDQLKDVSAAGHAAERVLFEKDLIGTTENDFLAFTIEGANGDMETFHGREILTEESLWDAHAANEFLTWAKSRVVPYLDKHWSFIEPLAHWLFNQWDGLDNGELPYKIEFDQFEHFLPD